MERLAREIDPLRYAHLEREVAGLLPLSSLERVLEAVPEGKAKQGIDSQVEVSLRFSLDEERNRVAKGHLKLTLVAECQRCLENLQLHLDHRFEWGFVWSDELAKHLPAKLEPIVLSDGKTESDLNLKHEKSSLD